MRRAALWEILKLSNKHQGLIKFFTHRLKNTHQLVERAVTHIIIHATPPKLSFNFYAVVSIGSSDEYLQ